MEHPQPASPFTLHVRLTKFCNAGCEYCSSWQESPDSKMTSEAYEKSLQYIYGLWQHYDIQVTHLTIEYVGGEVLLLRESEIRECVELARDFFGSKGIAVIDGVQSNLIGTSARIENLKAIFPNRIGTSIDSFSDQRKFKGSAKKYRTFFMEGEQKANNHRGPLPAVFTVDGKTLSTALDEVDLAIRDGRDLMVRPVFGGGMAVEMPSPSDLGNLYVNVIERWWMSGNVRVEPFYSLLKKRLHHQYAEYPDENFDYCSFQSDCTRKSMSLEPNGDLFICQDMADANRERLGNALQGEFRHDLWAMLAMRPYRLDPGCYACDYFKECQGGCLLKSLESGSGIYGKASHCHSWKMLFSTLDAKISSSKIEKILAWIAEMDAPKAI